MKKGATYPELPLAFEAIKKVQRYKKTERSRDSEGRYTMDLPMHTKHQFTETEKRRNESMAAMLRIKDEEIIRLKQQIKAMLHD